MHHCLHRLPPLSRYEHHLAQTLALAQKAHPHPLDTMPGPVTKLGAHSHFARRIRAEHLSDEHHTTNRNHGRNETTRAGRETIDVHTEASEDVHGTVAES